MSVIDEEKFQFETLHTPKKTAVVASTLIGAGALAELYATATIVSERVPGNTGAIVALGVVAMVGSIGALMPRPEAQVVEDSSADI